MSTSMPTPALLIEEAEVSAFHDHPAQMRTRYDLDEMATLTLQLCQEGLDSWQPIVAVPMPAETCEGYYILSGHRRRLAWLFARALERTHSERDDDLTLDLVRDFFKAQLAEHGDFESASAALVAAHPTQPLPFVRFQGDEKAQILALQRANYGVATPDKLGIALSFQRAIAAGATVAEIARNAGQHVQYVHNHLALTRVPTELAQIVADDKLPLSVAVAVAQLDSETRRLGLSLAILAADPLFPTASAVQQLVKRVKAWSGLQLPLDADQQASRNLARALVRLWQQSVERYPTRAWAALASLVLADVEVDRPWERPHATQAWLHALAGDHYVDDDQGIRWERLLAEQLPEVSCTTCPIATLPDATLCHDVVGPHWPALQRPCRRAEADKVERCWSGFAPKDAVRLIVPWSWADHEGVEREGHRYVVEGIETLRRAWQAQAGREAERADEVDLADTIVQSLTGSGSLSPIEQQRQLIAEFIARHGAMNSDHPLATCCERCQHQLTTSPTKNPAVPHCAWAARRRNVSFHTLRDRETDELRPIPVCRQFAPIERWTAIIPATEGPLPAGTSRHWLQAQIRALAAAASYAARDREPFEFLTGRPMSASVRRWRCSRTASPWSRTMTRRTPSCASPSGAPQGSGPTC